MKRRFAENIYRKTPCAYIHVASKVSVCHGQEQPDTVNPHATRGTGKGGKKADREATDRTEPRYNGPCPVFQQLPGKCSNNRVSGIDSRQKRGSSLSGYTPRYISPKYYDPPLPVDPQKSNNGSPKTCTNIDRECHAILILIQFYFS